LAFGAVTDSGCEWMWVDTVLSEPSPEMIVTGALIPA
jgi:hypothetical protein